MYGKIYPQLYTGSMVGAGAMVFALWPYIITNARPDDGSLIDLNPVVIAAVFGVTAEEVSKAIEFLCNPDPHSRTPAHEGRRLIKKGPMSYFVVNLEKYRLQEDRYARRDYWRNYKRKKRNSKKIYNVHSGQVDMSKMSRHVDVDVDVDVDVGTTKKKPVSPSPEHKAFIDGWCSNFRAAHGVDYVFCGGRDGKATKELLRMGILRLDLLEIAKKAWERGNADKGAWACKQAVTIHGFHQLFNRVRTELANTNGKNTTNHHTEHVDRSIGTTNEGTAHLYAGLGKLAQGKNPPRSET